MNHAVTPALLDAIARFRLAFGCERCAHADATGACSLEYPNDEHVEATLEQRGALVFCKEFELG
jgi:hypothetical protein